MRVVILSQLPICTNFLNNEIPIFRRGELARWSWRHDVCRARDHASVICRCNISRNSGIGLRCGKPGCYSRKLRHKFFYLRTPMLTNY
ncbi:MAG: hypothetical protein EoVTN8_76 [Fluviibacter phosphoraccumulans EoVTN8]